MGDNSNGAGDRERAAQIAIDMIQMGPGWVFFEAGQSQSPVPELPLFLNQTLMGWLKEHPHYRIRATQGIVLGGMTVGLHAWYDIEEAKET